MQEPITKENQSPKSLREEPSLIGWHVRMLPTMKWMVVGLTFFFFIASFIQLLHLQSIIEHAPKVNIQESYLNIPNQTESLFQESLAISKFKASVILEMNALERRHHQANVLLMSRVWVRYLGFVTGMILALVGAIFILGKLQEPITELGVNVEVTKFKLTSSSPGIILSFLGVALMLATIFVHHTIEVRDSAIYTLESLNSSSSTSEITQPPLDK